MIDSGRDEFSGQARIFRIRNRKYAFGLFWQAPGNDYKSALQEAKTLARESQFNSDLYVIRNDEVVQFGLARKEDNSQIGAMAAAVCAANTIKGTWVGAIRVGSGWWCIAVLNGYIQPDGDRFFNSEEEARKHFEELVAEGGWNQIFGPSEWNENYEDLTVENLLANAKGPRIYEINPLGSRLKVLLLSTGLAVLLAAAAIWYVEFSGSEDPDAFRDDLANQVKNTTDIIEKVRIEPTWYARPETSIYLTRCLGTARTLDAEAPGWTLGAMQCGPNGLTVGWRINGGTVDWIEDWRARHHPDRSLSFSADYTQAYMTVPFPEMTRRGPQAIHDAASIRKLLAGARQATGTPIEIGDLRAPNIPSGVDPKTVERPNFAPMAFRIQTKTPEAWIEFIGAIPGLVIDRVDYEADRGEWRIKGDIYVRN